jgi:hypothetical protein
MLAKRQNNCKSPFLVLVSDASQTRTTRDSEPSSADPRSILNSYSDGFEEPSAGLIDGLAPPSVPTVPDVVPPNRPAFRLSLLERQELESRVTKMLKKGWILKRVQPSSSGDLLMGLLSYLYPNLMGLYACVSITTR